MTQSNTPVGPISTKEAIDKTGADLDDVLKHQASMSPVELELRLKQVHENLQSMANHSHDIHTGPVKP
jgi:hypothetical protein